MPTRRIFELIILTGLLMRPAFGIVHLWAVKTLGTQKEGTFAHKFAEVTAVVTG